MIPSGHLGIQLKLSLGITRLLSTYAWFSYTNAAQWITKSAVLVVLAWVVMEGSCNQLGDCGTWEPSMPCEPGLWQWMHLDCRSFTPCVMPCMILGIFLITIIVQLIVHDECFISVMFDRPIMPWRHKKPLLLSTVLILALNQQRNVSESTSLIRGLTRLCHLGAQTG